MFCHYFKIISDVKTVTCNYCFPLCQVPGVVGDVDNSGVPQNKDEHCSLFPSQNILFDGSTVKAWHGHWVWYVHTSACISVWVSARLCLHIYVDGCMWVKERMCSVVIQDYIHSCGLPLKTCHGLAKMSASVSVVFRCQWCIEFVVSSACEKVLLGFSSSKL